jgi:hypothetical protein
MDIYVAGKGKVTLTDSKDFIAQGGQGKIYAKGSTVYKIYENPSDMIPSAKIQELSVLSDPKIIRPQDVILNNRNREIGYTMRRVENALALCETFPQAFWLRKKLTHDQMMKLILGLQETIHSVHENNILIVDLNEMNFLVDEKLKVVYLIDVDNYETRNFKCCAIMPNARDWQAKSWNRNTDWYSFGLLTFNMLVGIHPFKGRHPNYPWPLTEAAMVDRMKHNDSVFDPRMKLPGSCRPLTAIPKNYLDWYEAMFVNGKRLPPPSTLAPAQKVTLKIQRVQGTDNFDIAEMFAFSEPIVSYHFFGGTEVTTTSTSVYRGNTRLNPSHTDMEIGITPKQRHVVTAFVENGHLQLINGTTSAAIPTDIAAEEVMGYDGRLYVKKSGNVLQVEFAEIGAAILPMAQVVAQCHEKAARFFDGVLIQPLLGKHFATIFPKQGQAIDVNISMVEGAIVDAKYDNNVLMVVGTKGGKYNRYVMRFDKSYGHDLKTVRDIPYVGLNFVVLDNGVCCNMTETEEIELFRNSRDDIMVKIVQDDNIDASMRLFKKGTQVLFAKGERLYTIKMK